MDGVGVFPGTLSSSEHIENKDKEKAARGQVITFIVIQAWLGRKAWLVSAPEGSSDDRPQKEVSIYSLAAPELSGRPSVA